MPLFFTSTMFASARTTSEPVIPNPPQRGVGCLLCGKPMYYLGEPEWVPEINLDIHYSSGKRVPRQYVHQSCWEDEILARGNYAIF